MGAAHYFNIFRTSHHEFIHYTRYIVYDSAVYRRAECVIQCNTEIFPQNIPNMNYFLPLNFKDNTNFVPLTDNATVIYCV